MSVIIQTGTGPEDLGKYFFNRRSPWRYNHLRRKALLLTLFLKRREDAPTTVPFSCCHMSHIWTVSPFQLRLHLSGIFLLLHTTTTPYRVIVFLRFDSTTYHATQHSFGRNLPLQPLLADLLHTACMIRQDQNTAECIYQISVFCAIRCSTMDSHLGLILKGSPACKKSFSLNADPQ